MITMKNIKKYLHAMGVIPVVLILLVASCSDKEDYVGPVSGDKSKPDVVTNVEVHNFNGGAYITYALPESGNVLYVEAEYFIRNNKRRQTKASYYNDTITVRGFEKSADYEVTLRSVSRANVKSDPVVVKVHPDTPPYLLVAPTIEVNPDFSGVNIKASNPNREPIGLILTAYDSVTGLVEIKDQYFSEEEEINYSVRGFFAVEQQVGVYITDEFGNISETKLETVTPFYEELLDKSKFFKYQLPNDGEIGYGWDLPYLWDNKTDGYSSGWHTNPGGSLPIIATFGLGVSAKLSRFILWERSDTPPQSWSYAHGNPKNFSIWGSDKDSPGDADLPLSAPVGTVIGDWINLGNYHFPDPPSGLPPGATNATDNALVLAGVNFNVPINSPAVKFLRISVADTWSNGDFAHAMEISVYGTPN
jgi:hypothetical protein